MEFLTLVAQATVIHVVITTIEKSGIVEKTANKIDEVKEAAKVAVYAVTKKQ